MSTRADERETAIAAADTTCPRCGAPREPDQRYCLECGLPLPATNGAVPALRRRWIRRLGWYPGDWVWLSLLTLLVAVAGAAVAIVVTRHRHEAVGRTFFLTQTQQVKQPTAVPTAAPTVDTATLPSPPEPTTTSAKLHARKTHRRSGPIAWPAGRSGWTIVLVSYPKTNGIAAADATAARASSAGLSQVGVLDSSQFASLVPGYYVVFTGVYGSKSDADAAVSTARQAGFAGAYSRQIAR
ncbi:MAG TPA: zinc ribbon domain-containing protein [Gaiellaceae bacterium]|nr:zinc ribbon domain-containing protein [Gaiellaceae bacterium]